MPGEEPTSSRFDAALTYLKSRLWFVISPMNVIDLLAILPLYIELAVSGENAFLNIVKIGRVFRLVKLAKYSKGMQLVAYTMEKSKEGLGMLMVMVIISVTLFSSAMFFAERGSWCGPTNDFCAGTAVNGKGWYSIPGSSPTSTYSDGCPVNWCRTKTKFDSIFSSGYWTMNTITTTGYGDMFPDTLSGHLLGSLIMISGLIILALPITVISCNFEEAYENEQFERLQFASIQDQTEINAKEDLHLPIFMYRACSAFEGRCCGKQLRLFPWSMRERKPAEEDDGTDCSEMSVCSSAAEPRGMRTPVAPPAHGENTAAHELDHELSMPREPHSDLSASHAPENTRNIAAAVTSRLSSANTFDSSNKFAALLGPCTDLAGLEGSMCSSGELDESLHALFVQHRVSLLEGVASLLGDSSGLIMAIVLEEMDLDEIYEKEV